MHERDENEQFAQLVDLLDRSIRQSQRLLHDFAVVRRTRRYKIFALILLNEISRKSEAVHAMARARSYSGINLVARGAMENYVDLINVFRLPDSYPDFLNWADHNQERTWLQALLERSESDFAKKYTADLRRFGQKSPGQFLASIVGTMTVLEGKLPAQYKDQNGKVIRRDILRFRLADKGFEYDVLYRHLSNAAHGRVSSMLEGIAKGEDIQWPPSKPQRRPMVAIDATCAMLIDSSILVSKQFSRPIALFRNLQRDQAKIRGVESGIVPLC